MFAKMIPEEKYQSSTRLQPFLILDMSDCYTWSFPEFIPFCSQLYYFSNYKDFNKSARV